MLTHTGLLVQDFWSGIYESAFLKGTFGIKRPTVNPGPESSLSNTITGRKDSDQRRVVDIYTSRQENSSKFEVIASPRKNIPKFYCFCREYSILFTSVCCFGPPEIFAAGPWGQRTPRLPFSTSLLLRPWACSSFLWPRFCFSLWPHHDDGMVWEAAGLRVGTHIFDSMIFRPSTSSPSSPEPRLWASLALFPEEEYWQLAPSPSPSFLNLPSVLTPSSHLTLMLVYLHAEECSRAQALF